LLKWNLPPKRARLKPLGHPSGWSFDVTGSYRVAFSLSIFFYACGSVAFWLLRRPAAKEE
jgi:hypothetical protein